MKKKVFGIRLSKASLVRWKIYLDRARMYLGLISFAMIIFVFLNDIKDVEIRAFLDQNKFIIYPVIAILFVLFSLLLGRLDTKFGMRSEEMRNHATANPVTMEILEHLRDIRAQQLSNAKENL